MIMTDAETVLTAEQIWTWLDDVMDPEIPVISIVDLGIVRAVALAHSGGTTSVMITITPTYSGCPAMAVIADAVRQALADHGIADVTLQTSIAPAWTTDWISESGKARLRDYGIAPPRDQAWKVIDIASLARTASPTVSCPHCGAAHTEMLSQFASTPCKALYRCLACREPFDFFKPL